MTVDRDGPAKPPQQPRDDKAVTAIVAGAAQDGGMRATLGEARPVRPDRIDHALGIHPAIDVIAQRDQLVLGSQLQHLQDQPQSLRAAMDIANRNRS